MAIPRNTCQATLVFEGENNPSTCDMGLTAGIVMTISEDQSTGTFWDVAAGTPDNPFTNPSMFDLGVGDGLCLNEDGEVVSFVSCDIMGQIMLNGVAMTGMFPANLTGAFPGCPFIPIPLIEIFANQAAIPGVSIEISFEDMGGGVGTFTIVVTKESGTVIIGTVVLNVLFDGVVVISFSAPLSCNIRRRKLVGAPCPPYIIRSFSGNPPATISEGGCAYVNPVLASRPGWAKIYRYSLKK